MNSSELPF